MRIIITEEQKKKLFIPLTESEQSKKGKLFIPRRIDERNEQLKGEIKKFLNSIKDSFIWDFIGEISVSYNFESDYEDISYKDINGKWLDMHRIGMKPYNILIEKYGEEKAKEMTIEFNKISDKIGDFINSLLDSEGYTVVYAWGEIINHGNGKLEYKEHRTRKIEQMDYRVVSL
jgi:hypothetical protein